MGRNRKRYLQHGDINDSQGFGLASALHSVKRRKLSDELDELSGDDAGQTKTTSNRDRHDDGGWQTVPSKSTRHNNQQHRMSKKKPGSYPKLHFDQPIGKGIVIEQLRDLALYVLADGVAPKWVGVKNSKAITKVVVLMVPGWDKEGLKRCRYLVDAISHFASCEQKRNREKLQSGNETDKTKKSESEPFDIDPNVDITPASIDTSGCSVSCPDFRDFFDLVKKDWVWLLNKTIPVKAPGDSKFCKVHSPLQAVLMVPEGAKEANRTHTVERQPRPIATPITHFIHTSDELREAEYPIHPATFTSTEDAALEASRRDSTGQSTATGWVDSDVTCNKPSSSLGSSVPLRDPVSQDLSIYALDCEMVVTSDQKSSLARISLVSWPNGKVVIDKFVKPDLPIENYHTQYSGITPKILENITTRLVDVQQELASILTSSAILLGHSLESDLNALKMTHPFIIDTSMVYPHPRGLPLRSSLKFLANKYLKREIQKGGADGHDSVEDARAVLDLVRLKCERGPKFGTTEANGETIFKRLSRHRGRSGKPLTTAMVEYGSSPERGLGKDATFTIGCQNDEEITKGIVRAMKGDEDGSQIPAGGADFIWGRLRALEFAKGWVTNNNTYSSTAGAVNETSSTDNDTANFTQPKSWKERFAEIDRTILTTLSHIDEIQEAIPPTTLLILYSGTGDVRPVLELQALQSQYRKEFKIKKWDELTVRWTDNEEQALRSATERARQGWGWAGVI